MMLRRVPEPTRRKGDPSMTFARSLPLTILPLTILLAAAPALAQEKHQLRLRFAPDTTVHSVTVQEMEMGMNMGGQDMSTTMKAEMFMTTKITGVDGNIAQLEQSVTRVKAKMNNPMMGKIDFDSAVEDSDPGALQGLADQVGQKTKVKLSDTGKVVEFKMDEELSEQASQTGIDLEQMVEQSVTMLPEQPVAIGETWQNDLKMPLGQMGEVDVKVDNKLMAVTDDHFVVEQTMKADPAAVELPGGMKLESMTSKGINKIDRRTGMPTEMTMETKVKMAGPMTMTSTIKLSMKPAPAPAEAAAEPAKTGAGK
jgi:hypothetical protein